MSDLTREEREALAGVLRPHVRCGDRYCSTFDAGNAMCGDCFDAVVLAVAVILTSDWLTAREQAAYERGAAEVRARVEAIVARWESEGSERGPDDMIYTSGSAAMLRAALDPAPSPSADDAGVAR